MPRLVYVDGDYSKLFNVELVTSARESNADGMYGFELRFGGDSMLFRFETEEARTGVVNNLLDVINNPNDYPTSPINLDPNFTPDP